MSIKVYMVYILIASGITPVQEKYLMPSWEACVKAVEVAVVPKQASLFCIYKKEKNDVQK